MKTDIKAGDLARCSKKDRWGPSEGPKYGEIVQVSAICIHPFSKETYFDLQGYSPRDCFHSKWFRKLDTGFKRATKQWDWNNQPVKVE